MNILITFLTMGILQRLNDDNALYFLRIFIQRTSKLQKIKGSLLRKELFPLRLNL